MNAKGLPAALRAAVTGITQHRALMLTVSQASRTRQMEIFKAREGHKSTETCRQSPKMLPKIQEVQLAEEMERQRRCRERVLKQWN